MKILHYFLGFPPYRSGGMTRYAYDLMRAQVCDGNQVYALWPGQIELLNSKVSIREQKSVNNIRNFELINPLPVSLDEGIQDVDCFMRKSDLAVYESFLDSIRPDIIHIHTLMGMHQELIEAAVKKKIRTVYTTHDYFGICPKVNLFRAGKVCEDDHNCADCIRCNSSALSVKKITLMQSPTYRKLKNSWPVKVMRKLHRNNFFINGQDVQEKDEISVPLASPESIMRYRQLRAFYINILEEINCIHYNSTLTKSIYEKYLQPQSSTVISVSHSGVSDHREESIWHPASTLRITMLAPAKPYKGFYVLRKALDTFWQGGKRNFVLQVFGVVPSPRIYMKVHERGFSQADLARIFAETDVLVAPSIWYETFGFTVLEAISYGVPVIVSDHVGAKDIIGDGGLVVPAGSAAALTEALEGLDIQTLKRMRDAIKRLDILDWRQHVEKIYNIYTEVYS